MRGQFIPLHAIASDRIETLLDGAFGPDRRARTAYRVRDGVTAIAELSFAMIGAEDTLLGSIQCWPVALAGEDRVWPLVMVGPVAVDRNHQNIGIGRALMAEMLARCPHAGDAGADALMLIGDPDYYARWGFTAERTGAWRLPGTFERHRLLARGNAVPDAAGLLRARPD